MLFCDSELVDSIYRCWYHDYHVVSEVIWFHTNMQSTQPQQQSKGNESEYYFSHPQSPSVSCETWILKLRRIAGIDWICGIWYIHALLLQSEIPKNLLRQDRNSMPWQPWYLQDSHFRLEDFYGLDQWISKNLERKRRCFEGTSNISSSQFSKK